MYRPSIEEIRCPCGVVFTRINRVGRGSLQQKKTGRPQQYCESCRVASRRGRPYGKALQEVEIKDDLGSYV